MIELIDILDDGEIAEEYLHNEEILRASIVMIEKNIFRTFANKSKYISVKCSNTNSIFR
jgi:CTP:phosphocholine cytidylyltransferase-like protein